MRKIALIAAALLCSVSLASYAQLSDDQVIEYVKTASAAGKSQEDITKELLLRGVTQEQAERIKARVQSGALSAQGSENAFGDEDGFTRNSGAGSRRTQTGSRSTLREGTFEDEYLRRRTKTRRPSPTCSSL